MSKRYIIPFLILVVFLLVNVSLSFADDKDVTAKEAAEKKAASEKKDAENRAAMAAKEASLKEGYVGAETCKGCHPESYEAYKHSVHSKPHVKGPGSKDACETCHGPGAKHVEKGGGRGVDIFNFDKNVEPHEKSAKCLACHQANKAQAFWTMSKHSADASGLSCDSCHQIMTSKNDKFLKETQPDLCFGCHKEIKMDASKQSHHPIKEGKIVCNDCHDPHGQFNDNMLRAETPNKLCFKCHADKRGPYMWEHPPVAENCLTCHTPHGSNHSRLLVMRPPFLCKDCHEGLVHAGGVTYNNTATFGKTTGANISNTVKTDLRACINCHVNIHGSNGPGVFGQTFIR
ncbi:MAG: DmsE family decaheme c-type cytochrome [Nitrospirae bacterium]|nr:DmsE family decaheme c-type cytochrome [Nitrospirota bacterium]MBF0536478.1 DmsE family decaheme c-type cytochrome [Nitrospirota bacterium]MBF0618513.1 DmsE family decaheme c-type cytochrome [Nitrospirota bacterium]